MAERQGEQRSTDGLRQFASFIRENVEMARQYGDEIGDDIAIAMSDNLEEPYVTVLVRQNELEDIEIHPDALIDFPDEMELSTLITSTIVKAFMAYQYELSETNPDPTN